MRFKIRLKVLTILAIAMGLLLLSGFLFLYNGKEGVKAQEVAGEILWKCGIEIPLLGEVKEIGIGEVIDEARQVASNITNAFNEITRASSQQMTLANQISQSSLPGECKGSNCQTDCNRRCVDRDGDAVCSDDEWHCEIQPCSGDACPVDKFIKDTQAANKIDKLYTDIEAATKTIKSEVGKRDDIMKKLEKARAQLSLCFTPTEGSTPEEFAQKQKILLPCDLAKRLSGDVEECSNEKNFFCCVPVLK